MPEFRSMEGELKLLETTNDFIFPVELWMLNDRVNRNNWKFINLEEHRAEWAGKPILVAYVNGGKTVGSGHNQTTKTDKNGQEYQSFTAAESERIVGAISDDPADVRLEERDGYTWVVGRGALWAWYSHELVMKIADDARQGRTMSVSIEALVTKSHMEGDVEVEENYIPLGITLLGDRVTPAVEDAHIAMLNSMGDELKELKLRAASYMNSAQEKNKTNEKGLKKYMRLSKQQLRELQEKFSGYTVLAAHQNEDNGVVVCLMDASGKTAIYRMASLDEAVAIGRVEMVNAQVHFCEEITVDACDMVEAMSEQVTDLTARLNSAEAKLTESENTISAMREAENKRRVSAAKDKAVATLSAFNANREEKVEEKVLEAVNADIEAGVYTASVDKDGNWCGDAAVQEKVLSLCASAVMEMDKRNATRGGEQMTWGSVKKASAAPGTIGELFARK